MATAFQPNAFQNNAFQIDGEPPPTPTTGSGGSRGDGRIDQWRKYLLYKKEKRKKKFFKRYARHARPEIKETIKRYQSIAGSIADDQKKILIAAVDPFVLTETQAEFERRQQALYAFDSPPPAFRIDFDSLLGNPFAKDRFDRMIEKLERLIDKNRLESEEDELLFIIAAFAW